MKVKRTISIRLGAGLLEVEVDALDLIDLRATTQLCLDGPANFRAMELASKIADDRAKWMPGAVYVITPDDTEFPVCKVGCGTDPNHRLSCIQVGNWNKLAVAALLWTDGGAYEIEQAALRAAKELGIYLRGEWIAAEPREACELVIKAARYIGKPVYDSVTWLENWSLRLHAVAQAKDRVEAIGRLKPRGQKFGT